MATYPQPTGEELEEAERYLLALDLPEDRPLLNDGQQYYTITQLALHGALFGMGEAAIRDKVESGEIPNAVMAGGWKIPRSGVLYYIAQRRRAAQRRTSAS